MKNVPYRNYNADGSLKREERLLTVVDDFGCKYKVYKRGDEYTITMRAPAADRRLGVALWTLHGHFFRDLSGTLIFSATDHGERKIGQDAYYGKLADLTGEQATNLRRAAQEFLGINETAVGYQVSNEERQEQRGGGLKR